MLPSFGTTNWTNRILASVSSIGRWHSLGFPILIGLVLQGSIFTKLCIFKVVSTGSCRNALGAASSLKFSNTHVNNMNDYWMLNWWHVMHTMCAISGLICTCLLLSLSFRLQKKKGVSKVVEKKVILCEIWKVSSLGWRSGPRSPCLQYASDRGGWRDASCPESQKFITETTPLWEGQGSTAIHGISQNSQTKTLQKTQASKYWVKF